MMNEEEEKEEEMDKTKAKVIKRTSDFFYLLDIYIGINDLQIFQ